MCNATNKVRLFPKTFGSLDDHFFQPHTCTVATKPLKCHLGVPIYKQLERRLVRAGKRVAYFSYDWRENPLSTAKQLMLRLRQSDWDHEPIVAIGHSNGGFILRILFEYLNFPRTNFRSIFICGTPLFGHTHFKLFNLEHDVYRALCGEVPELKFRPMLLSRHDMSRTLGELRDVLLYFVPSSIFATSSCEQIAANTKAPITDVLVAKQVHAKLGNLLIDKYFMWYNTSEWTEQTIPFDKHTIGFALQEFPHASKVDTHSGTVLTQCRGDSVVCSPNFAMNRVIYDYTNLHHSLMMNSKSLASFIIAQ